jgi:phage protein D
VAESTVSLTIDGEAVDPAALGTRGEIVLEDTVDEADAASLTANLTAGADGEWTSALDALVAPHAPLQATVAFDGTAYTFDGVAVEATWHVTTSGEPTIVVRALDRTAEMDLDEKVAAWPGASDSSIASSILAAYGFAAQVDETPAGFDPDVHTVVQRATDWAFLRDLAGRWGFHTFLEASDRGITGHFRRLDPTAAPQAELSLAFGGQADEAEVRVDLAGGRRVDAAALAPLAAREQTATAELPDPPMGTTPLGAVGTALLAPGDVAGVIEPTGAARAHARANAQVARLTVTLDGGAGVLLRAGRPVLVSGLGGRLSGRWMVQRVRHTVTTEQHTQRVELSRDALDAAAGDLGGGGLV